MALSEEELNDRFGDHSAKIEGPEDFKAHDILRYRFMRFALYLDEMIPDSRSKAIAFTELEAASMWAHKAMINKENN